MITLENEILEILKQMQKENQEFRNDVASKFDDVNSKFDDVNSRFDDVNSKLDRVEKKLDAVYAQTAELTEFRTEVNLKLDKIENNLNSVEIITSKNWNDIAKLKAVK